MNEPTPETRGADVAKSASANMHQNPFVLHLNAKGYSLRRLAREMGISHSLLGHYSSGERPIPMARAEEIERIVGYAATATNWPKLQG